MEQQEIKTWLADVRQEKDKGAMITEHDIDSIIELLEQLLEQAVREHRAIQDVIALRDELLATEDGPVATVAKAFGEEIDRALRGHRR